MKTTNRLRSHSTATAAVVRQCYVNLQPRPTVPDGRKSASTSVLPTVQSLSSIISLYPYCHHTLWMETASISSNNVSL